jgi:hypothetical protein
MGKVNKHLVNGRRYLAGLPDKRWPTGRTKGVEMTIDGKPRRARRRAVAALATGALAATAALGVAFSPSAYADSSPGVVSGNNTPTPIHSATDWDSNFGSYYSGWDNQSAPGGSGFDVDTGNTQQPAAGSGLPDLSGPTGLGGASSTGIGAGIGGASISLTKSSTLASGEAVSANEPVGYAFTVTNTGTAAVYPGTVSDTGLDGTPLAVSCPIGCTGTLAPGASATYVATGTVTAADLIRGYLGDTAQAVVTGWFGGLVQNIVANTTLVVTIHAAS